MFEQRAVRSGLPRFGHQIDDVVSEKPAREKGRPGSTRSPLLGPRQEVLWILREGPHLPSPDVQEQVVSLIGVGRSHVAGISAIDHSYADRRVSFPGQVQGEK